MWCWWQLVRDGGKISMCANKNTPLITLQYFDGVEWIDVSQWVNDAMAWVSLGGDDFNYRTIDSSGNIITNKGGDFYV